MKKIFKSFVIIFTMLFLLVPISFASDTPDIETQIEQEDGSLFEKLIANCIGGIAQTVLDFTSGENSSVGFKDYDTLIFNDRSEIDSLSPFTEELWNKTMNWYSAFAVISEILILIAVFILAYKIINVGINTARRNEVKESITRLFFGGVAIRFSSIIY